MAWLPGIDNKKAHGLCLVMGCAMKALYRNPLVPNHDSGYCREHKRYATSRNVVLRLKIESRILESIAIREDEGDRGFDIYGEKDRDFRAVQSPTDRPDAHPWQGSRFGKQDRPAGAPQRYVAQAGEGRPYGFEVGELAHLKRAARADRE